MTPKQAGAALRKLQEEVGAGYSAGVSLHTGELPLGGTIFRNMGDYKTVVRANGDSFQAVIERLTAMWGEYKATARSERVKAMALAVIKITDEAGHCNEASLRMGGFDREEIADLGEEAAVKANEMAGRGPFTIERSANSNATEAA
jgi:hypothetical protein